MPTVEITAQYPELTAVDVKAARISSYSAHQQALAEPRLLLRSENAELLQRLTELAALLHAGQDCCSAPVAPM